MRSEYFVVVLALLCATCVSQFCQIGPDNLGCANNSTCYFNSQLNATLCGCRFGFAPPTCARPSPPVPLCNISNAAVQPPNCVYCNLTNNDGCLNHGICYVQSLTGAAYPPNFAIPICSCKFGWSGPTCAAVAPTVPLCNVSGTLRPPFCNYCRLGNGFPYSQGGGTGNGCYNFGNCVLLDVTGPGVPPGFQTPGKWIFSFSSFRFHLFDDVSLHLSSV